MNAILADRIALFLVFLVALLQDWHSVEACWTFLIPWNVRWRCRKRLDARLLESADSLIVAVWTSNFFKIVFKAIERSPCVRQNLKSTSHGLGEETLRKMLKRSKGVSGASRITCFRLRRLPSTCRLHSCPSSLPTSFPSLRHCVCHERAQDDPS